MTPQLTNKHRIFSRLGSFWSQNMKEGFDRDLARIISRTPDISPSFTTIGTMQDWLAGKHETTTGYDEHRFHFADVIVVGPDLQKRIINKYTTSTGVKVVVVSRPETDTAGFENHGALREDPGSDHLRLASENLEILMFPMPDGEYSLTVDPAILRPMYFVPWPRNHRPVSLYTRNRDFVAGIDFHCVEGALVFSEPPSVLFPDGVIFIRAGRQSRASFMSYTLQCDNLTTPGNHIADYLRNRSSFKAFELACAQYAGLAIPEVAAVIERITVMDDGSARYEHADGVFEIPYQHEHLWEGEYLSPSEIPGNVMKFHGPQTGGYASWYRTLDWSEGLSLDGISPVKGLVVLDQPCKAWAWDSTGAKHHVRLELQASDAALMDLHWERVKRAENVSGIYANDVFELSTLGDSTTINALDYYFNHLLAHRAIVIDISRLDAGRAVLVREFVMREKPVGAIIIYYTGIGPAYVDTSVEYLASDSWTLLTDGPDYYLTI